MPWLRLQFETSAHDAPVCAEALEEHGAAAVTLEDARDEPRYEMATQETPLWPRVRVSALFPDDTDVTALRAWLGTQAAAPNAGDITTDTLADREWEREWMQHYQPLRVGNNLWVCPSWCQPPAPQAVNILLDPGLAFGTGTHPSTALCLQWLSEQELAGKSVLDYGCGSGILAIAALRLGADTAVGIDSDASALEVSRENAERNGVGGRLACYTPDGAPNHLCADVVVANILAPTLIELAPTLTAAVKPLGALALAGILGTQVADVRHLYTDFNLECRAHGEWALLAGYRRRERL